jgi:basic membrane protein A
LQVSRRLIALSAASAILIAACGGSAATTAPSTAPSTAPTTAPAATTAPASVVPATTAPESSAPAVDYKACVAFDTGGLGDKGFNDLAMKGLNDAKAAGFKIAFSEAQGATDYAANIQRLIDEGCNSIVTVGFNQAQATIDATLANTDVAFSQVDATWNEAGADFKMGTADDMPFPPNFTGLDFQIDEAGTLAGYLAAGFSKSKIIGTYGGQQFPGVTRFMDGLYAGIKIYNEKKSATVKLLGWDAAKQTGTFVGGDNPWGDAAKGEQLAKTFMDQGADIVHPVAGSTGNGSIKAMLGAGKWAIGVDTDQAVSLPEYAKAILTSSEKVIDVAVLDTIKKNAGGDMGGENYMGTLANGGVRLSAFHDLDSQVSAELKAEVAQLQKDIASGTVKIADYLK